MSSSAPLRRKEEGNDHDEKKFTNDDWSTVRKGGKIDKFQCSTKDSQPANASIQVCWASLFETPRLSPVSRPISPEREQKEALDVIASVSPISISWKNLQVPCKVRTRGMINNGNMCFLNSILQSLIHCAPLANLMQSLPSRLLESLDTPFLHAFGKFFSEFYEPLQGDKKGSIGTVSPKSLLSCIHDSRRTEAFQGAQEDAQEFLTFILDVMHEEFATHKEFLNWEFSESTMKLMQIDDEAQEDGWLEVGKGRKVSETRTMRTAETPISFLFSGQFRSRVKRSGSKDSITFEPFNCLQLEVHHRHIYSIEDSLAYLSRSEMIQPGLTKFLTINKLPMILIIQLKRFVYNKEASRIEKVMKYIEYPERLVIGKNVCSSFNVESGQPTYRLFSVVYHHGRQAGGGHYTADVRKSFKQDDPWMRINDINIGKVSLDQVLKDKHSDRTAYLLFYQRVKDVKSSVV